MATAKEEVRRVVGNQRPAGVAGVEELRPMSPDNSGRIDQNGIAVEAQGRALKVHAGETPHLVSLGSDRFSTAVTLHPIPKGIVAHFFGVALFSPSLLCLSFCGHLFFFCVCVCPFTRCLFSSASRERLPATFSRMTCMLAASSTIPDRDES